MSFKMSNAYSFVRLHGNGSTHISPVWGEGDLFPYTLCGWETRGMYKLNADSVWEKYICDKCKDEYIEIEKSAPIRLSEALDISEEDAKKMIEKNKDRPPLTRKKFLEIFEKAIEKE